MIEKESERGPPKYDLFRWVEPVVVDLRLGVEIWEFCAAHQFFWAAGDATLVPKGNLKSPDWTFIHNYTLSCLKCIYIYIYTSNQQVSCCCQMAQSAQKGHVANQHRILLGLNFLVRVTSSICDRALSL